MYGPIRYAAFLIVVTFVFCAATPQCFGQEPAWWTKQKKDCGLPANLAYNSWDGSCPGSSRTSSGGDNGEAERQRQARLEAERQQRARDEAERERLAQEERDRQAAEQKKRDAERDEAYKSLKGSTGKIGTTILTNSGTNTGPLIGSRVDTGVKDGRPKTGVRDFSGPNSAWKQLFCAADIMSSAIASLNIRDERSIKTDPVQFRDLANEASNALDGDPKGIPCRAAPGLPKFSSKYDSPGKLIEASQRLLNNVVVLADKLERARETKSTAAAIINKSNGTATGKPLADPVAEQRRLNALRDAEAKRLWKAQKDFEKGELTEKDAKTKIGKIQDDLKKAAEDPEYFGVVLDEDAPAPKPAPPGGKHKP